METFRVSAHTKAIICGEHSVVYGGWAISSPLERKKEGIVTAELSEEGRIIVDDVVGSGFVTSEMETGAEDRTFLPKEKLITHILDELKIQEFSKKITVDLSKSMVPKGTGGSAATALCIAKALYRAFGIKPATEQLFNAIQVFEEVAHGGKPSGIDARTVISEKPLKFRKEFLKNGTVKYEFEEKNLKLPEGACLLLVNTLKKGETAETTLELLEKFAKNNRIRKKPAELTETERKKITEPFNRLVSEMEKEMKSNGNAEKLGKLFSENHALLKDAGVSSNGIEEAIGICLSNDALGAKITGAGGRGGAVLALINCKDEKKITEALKGKGFESVKEELV